MLTYAQFCPVAKAAEVFGDRWTPIIMRELCFGTRGFGELLDAAPLISRTVLAQRLKQLAQAGVIYIDAKPKGKGHLYRLSPAGEDFRAVVELMSVWGQRWGQGLIGPDDLDPQMLVWGMRRQIDPAEDQHKASSSASISAAYPKPIEACVTGGWYCDPKISRYVSKRPPETSMSSSGLISRHSPGYGSAMRDLQPRLRAENLPARLGGGNHDGAPFARPPRPTKAQKLQIFSLPIPQRCRRTIVVYRQSKLIQRPGECSLKGRVRNVAYGAFATGTSKPQVEPRPLCPESDRQPS
jgi:DNA-binding HxlR family transcriptional regulator